MASNIPDSFGASPASVTWTVVRGDTARLRVEFLNTDEITMYDTSGWIYSSTAFDPKTGTSYTLSTTPAVGYVDITATPSITTNWGPTNTSISAELAFDLQVTISEDNIWTPVLGTIVVLSDVTRNDV